MEKKITVTLSPVAAKYFADVQYSLDYGKGVCTQSQVINHCLEELCAFEDITEDQLTNWIMSNHKKKYKEWIVDNGINVEKH